ncbi:MAG: phosphatase PAP2 family protein [Coriobacteriia bacterium]|nr:phosphatase PAP2 family protein [Coriobacteriia bacterium]
MDEQGLRTPSARVLRAVAVVCAALFIVVWQAWVHVPALGWFDVDAALLLDTVRAPLLDALARGLAAVGDTLGVLATTAVAAGMLLAKRRCRDASFVAGTVAVGVALSTVVKGLVDRVRPGGATLVELPSSGSFPSGHVVAAACLAGALAMLVCLDPNTDLRRRVGALAAAAAWTLVMGVSRVYAGVHFASDVLSGALLGTFVVCAASALRVASGERRAARAGTGTFTQREA